MVGFKLEKSVYDIWNHMRRLGMGRTAVLAVAELAANRPELAQITECPSTMYGGPSPPLIVANDSEILRNPPPPRPASKWKRKIVYLPAFMAWEQSRLRVNGLARNIPLSLRTYSPSRAN